MDITGLSATALAAGIRDRSLSAVEVVRAYAARIDSLDGAINAVVAPCIDRALEEARAADRAVAAGGDLGALHGVPVTIKESIAVQGLPWTNGSRLFAGRRAERDAGAVRHLRAAGAIVLGKTNVPEFCAWYDTDNDVYGRTVNPHAAERSPGGSSGGEAAALAARLSPLGVGSDLGSSIRQPAAWTGVFGLKPTRDLVPLDGHAGFGLPLSWRVAATIGPMARSADDIALALAAMAGRPLPEATGGRMAVAVFEDDDLQPVAHACRAAVRRAADVLAEAGHVVAAARPPHQVEVRGIFDRLVVTDYRLFAFPAIQGHEHELSAHGRRAFDGLERFVPDLEAYAQAGARLSEIEAVTDEWQQRSPIAICPVVPVPAPVAAEGLVHADGEPMRPGGKLTLCTWANMLGLPAISVPAGRDGGGLPLAVQVVGRRGFDADVVAIARELETALGGAILL